MRSITFLAIAILSAFIFISCTNNKKDGALVVNKGADDFGGRYSMECESNICDTLERP